MARKGQQKALETLTKAARSQQGAKSGNLVVGDETGFGPAGKYKWVQKTNLLVEYVDSAGIFDACSSEHNYFFKIIDHVSLHEQKLVKKGAKCVLITGYYDREDGRRMWESALYFKKPKAKRVLPRRG